MAVNSPLWLVAMTVWLYAGWQLFPNGPRAFYVSSGAVIAALMLMLWRSRGAYWGPACALGALLGLLQSTCGAIFTADIAAREFLCDKGTATPVSAITLWLTLIVVAFYSTKRGPHGNVD